MKILIVENEHIIREELLDLMDSLLEGKHEIRTADGVKSSLEILQNYEPDLVFLDVELNDGTGIDLLDSLGSIPFQTVFMTAHDKYAMEAFRFSACDFLLKPLDKEKVQNALDKAHKTINLLQNQLQIEMLKEMILDQIQGAKPEKIVLKDKQSIYVVQISDIVCLEAQNAYTTFILKSQQQIVVSKGIREYQDLLEDKGFSRVHQSHLVNLNCILKYDRINLELTLLGDLRVPVAHRKKEMLVDQLSRI